MSGTPNSPFGWLLATVLTVHQVEPTFKSKPFFGQSGVLGYLLLTPILGDTTAPPLWPLPSENVVPQGDPALLNFLG